MGSDRFILAYSGEVYNHREIRRELPEARFVGNSDTETILRALEHWGVQETLRRLNGIYAFAVWDRLVRGLTLARDPMGIKPLCYLHREPALYFASELKALGRYSEKRFSRQAAFPHLALGFVPSPYTLAKDTHKVGSGEVVTFGSSFAASGWIHPRVWANAGAGVAAQDLPAWLKSKVESAVERQLLSDVPAGAALSVGIDPSIVAALAAWRIPRMASFSVRPAWVTPQTNEDTELGLEHPKIEVRPQGVLEEEGFPDRIGEPFSEPGFPAEFLIARAGAARGFPVLLTSRGANEVFLDYEGDSSVPLSPKHTRWLLLDPALLGASRLPFLPAHRRRTLRVPGEGWRKPVTEWRSMVNVLFLPHEASRLVDLSREEARALLEEVSSSAAERGGAAPATGSLHPVKSYARLDLFLEVPDHHNLRLDQAGMAASVEAQVPFENLELIEEAFSLRYDQLIQGRLKGLLEAAFQDLLAPEILHRTRKQIFQAPVSTRLARPLRAWVEMYERSGLWNRAALSGDLNLIRETYRTWSLAFLEACRQHQGLEV